MNEKHSALVKYKTILKEMDELDYDDTWGYNDLDNKASAQKAIIIFAQKMIKTIKEINK